MYLVYDKDGQLQGPGRIMSTNGDVYDGSFRRGKFHGFGKTSNNSSTELNRLFAGTYYQRDKNQWFHGLYEDDICKQVLKVGNGFPHNIPSTTLISFKPI